MRSLLKLASVLAVAAVLGFAPAGQAADPDGVLTAAAPKFTWETSVPASVSVVNNVSTQTEGAVPNCLNADAEQYLCDVKIVEYKGGGPRPMLVQIEFEMTSDYDLYLYDEAGKLLGDSAAGINDGSTSETIQVRVTPGKYRIEVVKFLAVNSVLKGSATLK